MSSPADSSDDYDLPDELPEHLRRLIAEIQPPPTKTTEWLVQRDDALSSAKTGKGFSYCLARNREPLAVRFYEVIRASKVLGVIVVNGPSLPGPTMLGRSPSKKIMHYRAWHGPSLSFADASWEVLKEVDISSEPRSGRSQPPPTKAKKVRTEICVAPNSTCN